MTQRVLVRESLKAIADFAYAVRFLKLLVTPFEKTDAFKFGVIDAKGKVLKKGKERVTKDEKNSYTVFHRLVFNLKKIIHLHPCFTRCSHYYFLNDTCCTGRSF